jgi:hypothetical protein
MYNLANLSVIFLGKKSADFVKRSTMTQVALLLFFSLGNLITKFIVISFHFHLGISNEGCRSFSKLVMSVCHPFFLSSKHKKISKLDSSQNSLIVFKNSLIFFLNRSWIIIDIVVHKRNKIIIDIVYQNRDINEMSRFRTTILIIILS